MGSNAPTQYATDANLRARQLLWEQQQPPFDLVGWTLELSATSPVDRVLDVGCGNGRYVHRLRDLGADVIGCDLSFGMVSAVGGGGLVNADVTQLPFAVDSFDVVLAPHMLYHVADRGAAVHELRRVLRPGGTCVALTNGADHTRSLREVVERIVQESTPGWKWFEPLTRAFSLENGAAQLAAAFDVVDCVRPAGVAGARITDASIAAGYVASVDDIYGEQIAMPWAEVVERARDAVQAIIDRDGVFEVRADVGAFVCS